MTNNKQIPLVVKYSKFESTLNSRNFLISLITLLSMVLGYFGITIGSEGGDVLDALSSGDFSIISQILIPIVLNIVTKLASKTFNFSWDFLRSLNFQVQFLTVILLGVTAYWGVSFEPNAAGEVVGSINTGGIITIIVSVLINVINPIIHFFKDKGTEVKQFLPALAS